MNFRIKKSSEFLEQGYSVTDAGVMSGFNNISYFIKVFKSKYNMPPNKFKQKFSKGLI